MPLFDRIPSPPSESARFPLAVAGVPRRVDVREVHWQLTPDFPLDQGAEGACVGFGCSAELSADPIMYPTGAPFAFRLYELAREQDRAMGYHFPEGATVLGGLRAMRKLGVIQGYAWARTALQVRDAVLSHGAVVMGTDWLAGMDTWDRFGLVRATGDTRGGHCWTIVGYMPAHPIHGAVFECINSWGPDWGSRGRFLLRPGDLHLLLEQRGGEAAIVTDTPLAPVPEPEPLYFAARWSVAFHDAEHWWLLRHRAFVTRADALAAGLRPCRICKP